MDIIFLLLFYDTSLSMSNVKQSVNNILVYNFEINNVILTEIRGC